MEKVVQKICRNSAYFLRKLSTNACLYRPIKVGEALPDVTLYESDPNDKVNIVDLFKGRKGILFAVPGAFTPGCSKAHIPEYLHNHEKFVSEGYEVVACVSVNDPFVMAAWGKDVDPEGKIHMLADTKREFTKAIDMELDCTTLLGSIRSKRYFMLIEDAKVQNIKQEPDDTGLACLLCIRKMKRHPRPAKT